MASLIEQPKARADLRAKWKGLEDAVGRKKRPEVDPGIEEGIDIITA
jgi:hypothetical protein